MTYVHDELLPTCQTDVTASAAARILTVRAISGEAKLQKMNISGWFNLAVRFCLEGTASEAYILCEQRKG